METAKNAVAQYKRDGYCVVRGLLPQSEANDLLATMHDLVLRQLKLHGLQCAGGQSVEAVHANLKTLFAHDQKIYLATLTLASKLRALYALYLHPNICGFAEKLGIEVPVWQTGPVLHLMSPVLRIPGGYYGFGMHQDWPSQQGSIDAVTVWVPLVDVDCEMHTMELIPGSHRKGLYPATLNEHILEIDPNSYNANDLVRVEAKRGDVVFFSSLLLHRSCTTGDDRLRVAASIRYENAAEPHFVARGYPAAQKRWAIKELITPGFPTTKQVQEVFE